jgi:hypothetical protein
MEALPKSINRLFIEVKHGCTDKGLQMLPQNLVWLDISKNHKITGNKFPFIKSLKYLSLKGNSMSIFADSM